MHALRDTDYHMNVRILLDFIKREAKDNTYITILVMTIISGLSNAVLLSVINYSTSKVTDKFNIKFILIFSIIFAIYIITKRQALKLAASFAENVIYGIRERIVRSLMNTELPEFEELGRAEMYARLTKDTNEISNSSSVIVSGAQAIVLVFFALIYLGFLNITALIIAIILMTIGISNFVIGSKKIQTEIAEANDIETQYFDKINEITSGFKELKLSQQKKSDLFFGKIQTISNNLKEKKIITASKMSYYIVFAYAFLYTLLGAMVYIVPALDKEVLTHIVKITSTILFIIMPLGEAISTFDSINKATVAVNNLTKLEEQLKGNTAAVPDDVKLTGVFEGFEKIKFDDLSFAYRDDANREQFRIGPVNFSINKGEIIFIIGGNGSGKSTLIKLITGLYLPITGGIYVDEAMVEKDEIQEYRELFAVIFSDFFIFSELYGVRDLDDKKVTRLLKQMRLHDKTGFKNGSYTNVNLSTGQRKRLAMISLILEDKSILVFDEWAADQDPEFRKYFYNELIFDFKKSGKTIIAITHDDHYFDKADKIYKMEYGEFTEYKV